MLGDRIIKSGNVNLRLVGHSRASEMTFFFIPSLKIALDLGGINKKYGHCRYAFLTHTHADHSVYLCSIEKAFVSFFTEAFVPFEHREFCIDYIRAYHEMDEARRISREEYDLERKKKYKMKGVKAGDVFRITKNGGYSVQVLECCHRTACRGYAFSKVRKKLKDQYSGLKSHEIKDLVHQNIEVSEEKLFPQFIFCGDTTVDFFEKNKEVMDLGWPILIIECTFIQSQNKKKRMKESEEEDLAMRKGHVHWNQLKPYVEKYPDTMFVLIHFSLKYSEEYIKEFFKKEGYKNVIPWTHDVETE